MQKKANVGITPLMWTILGAVIGIVVIFYLVGNLAPTLTTAATNISGSGLPLAALFSSTGVLFTLFMIFLFVGLIILIAKMAKGRE